MKKNAFIFLILFRSVAIFAQESYNLQRCLEAGLQKNYDIRIIRNEERISANNVSWGNVGFLPSLDLNVGYSGDLDNRINQKYTGGETDKNKDILNQGANVGLNLAWTVFDGLQMQTNYERLKQFHEAGELNTKLVIENWIAGFVAEYYNYVHHNLQLANLRYAVLLSKERMRIAAEKYNIGSDSRLDMLQAKVDFNADSSNLIKQYEVVYKSGVNLNRMMAADDVSQKIVVSDSIIALNSSLDEEILRQSMLRSNYNLLLSAKNRTVSELDYRALKGRNYPYIKFNAGYGYTLNTYGSGSLERMENLGLTYGFTLGFNIFDGMNRNREQKNARITIENRLLQYEQLEQSLQADLAQMLMAYRNNLDLIQLERENLQSARENYEIAIERYRLGTLSGIELREAQNSLLNAEERLLQAEFNTKICEISLMQISGQASDYLK
ncbi:MAG: TolC family protein [Dysgonamonadaceae bacterium]|jgi:outer membrane protein TolC|nr:TolC family protein [Dysgonamonadaceae bacterium]